MVNSPSPQLPVRAQAGAALGASGDGWLTTGASAVGEAAGAVAPAVGASASAPGQGEQTTLTPDHAPCFLWRMPASPPTHASELPLSLLSPAA